jgi:hypothetical protein
MSSDHANRIRESALKLPMADSDLLTELLNPTVRVASKPSDACGNHRVSLLGHTRGAEEGKSECQETNLLGWLDADTFLVPAFSPTFLTWPKTAYHPR